TVGEVVDRGRVEAVRASLGIHALGVELRVDRVGPCATPVELAPHRAEPVVVLAPAERAGTVAGGERGRFVEEEELGEATRLQQRLAVPAAKREPAGDPALTGEAP